MPRRTRPKVARNIEEQVLMALVAQRLLREHGVDPHEYMYWVAHRLRQHAVHAVVLVVFLVLAVIFFLILQSATVATVAVQERMVLTVLVAAPLCLAAAWGIATRLLRGSAFGSQGRLVEFARWCSTDYIRRLTAHEWQHIAEFLRWPLDDRRQAYDALFADNKGLPPLRIGRPHALLTVARQVLGWLSIVTLAIFIFSFNTSMAPSVRELSLASICFIVFMLTGGAHLLLKSQQYIASPTYLDSETGTMQKLYEKVTAMVALLLGLFMTAIGVIAVLMMQGIL